MDSENTTDFILSADQIVQFREDGYLIIPNFLSEEEILSMKNSCWKLVDEMDPDKIDATIFISADKKSDRNKYFLDSGDNVSFFFEEEAIDEKGTLKVDKHLALNKIGHALHWCVPEFKTVSFSPKVKKISKQFGFKSPAVVQSMYIFKPPGFGGEVFPHKDCTFLSTNPQSCVGFWFALEDAHENNSCLWVSPGSHKTGTKRRFIRNPGKGPLTMFNAPSDPDDPSKYIPAPVKKGTLVLIHGQVDHKSAKNRSQESRHIYTFHVVEREETEWDPNNWLQPTKNMPFTGLYEN